MNRSAFQPKTGAHFRLMRSGRASSRRGGLSRQGVGGVKFLQAGGVRRWPEMGGTARRENNRRSRVASLKLRAGSAASPASRSDSCKASDPPGRGNAIPVLT